MGGGMGKVLSDTSLNNTTRAGRGKRKWGQHKWAQIKETQVIKTKNVLHFYSIVR